jgi:Asp-tRNA(Asn)/Glu-tRNA(Gln) amidotransferase A subunit family amidase
MLARAMIAAAGIPEFRRFRTDEPAIVRPPLPLDSQSTESQQPESAWSSTPVPSSSDHESESAAAFVAAYRAGDTTPDVVAERFIESVAASDGATPPLRAFIAVDATDLRQQAAASTRRWRAGIPRGVLDGVPVAVKDELDQTPYATSVGTCWLGREPAQVDATVVARLRRAGALLVGKLNMHEIGLGVTGINPHHGTARNPYDPDRMTGGSSSGSAAAVAGGLCPIAVSADAGGSIRIPSSLCGTVGLKPTFGRMSERGAAVLCWSIAHVGAIGATAADVALAYITMAGIDPTDANTRDQPAPHLNAMRQPNLSGKTIGVYRPWFEDADAAVVAACDQMLRFLVDAGAQVREIEIPDLHLVRPVHFVTAAVEWATAFAQLSRQERRHFGLDVRLTLRLARQLEPTDYVHAQRLRRRICDHFAKALREVDVIATPTTASTAPLIPIDALTCGESDLVTLDRMTRFVLASNLTGHPAISFPAGYDSRGLPIGLQLIGRAWCEDLLLHMASVAARYVEPRTPRRHFRLLNASPARAPVAAVGAYER